DGAIDVRVFDIQDGIDSVRFQERAKPILESKAGEQTPLMPGMLPIDVEFCCPPSPCSIFEFIQSAQECVQTVRPPSNRTRSNLQSAWFLHIMVVRNEVGGRRSLLSKHKGGQQTKSCEKTDKG